MFTPPFCLSVMKLLQIIDRLGKNNNGCIIWNRGKGKPSSTHVLYNDKIEIISRLIFKLKYRITHLPSWAFICHSCDTPLCCNPEHLFLGNAEINMRDMLSKERDNYTGPRFTKGIRRSNMSSTEKLIRALRLIEKDKLSYAK